MASKSKIASLFVAVNGDTTGLQSSLKKAGKSVSGFNTTLGDIKAKYLVVAAAAKKFTNAITRMAGDYETAMQNIVSATGASGAVLEDFKQSLKNVAGTTGGPLASIGAAIGDINTLTGATGTVLETLARQAASIESMTGESAKDVAARLSAASNLFGTAVEDLPRSFEILFAVSKRTGASVSDITNVMARYGATLKSFGFSLDETAGIVGLFQANGLQARRAMSALNQGLANLARSGVTDLRSALGSVVDRIKNASTSSEKLNLAMKIFGANGATQMVAAIDRGAFALEKINETIETTDNGIADALNSSRTWTQALTDLKTTVSFVIGDLIGLKDSLRDLFDTMVVALKKFGDTIQEVGGLWKAFKDTVKLVVKNTGQDIKDLFSGAEESQKQYEAETKETQKKLVDHFTFSKNSVEGLGEAASKAAEEVAAASKKMNQKGGAEVDALTEKVEKAAGELGGLASGLGTTTLEDQQRVDDIFNKGGEIGIDGRVGGGGTAAGGSGKTLFGMDMKQLGQTLAEGFTSGDFSSVGEKIVQSFLAQQFEALGNSLFKQGEQFNLSFAEIFNSQGNSFLSGLGNILTSLLSSLGDALGGIFNAIGGAVGSIFGFASGGQFEVGGSGGTDSSIVAFRASPKEVVTVSRPTDMALPQGGSIPSQGGPSVIQNINVHPSTAEQTRQEIFNMLPMIKKSTTDAVGRSVQKGGKNSRKIRGER